MNVMRTERASVGEFPLKAARVSLPILAQVLFWGAIVTMGGSANAASIQGDLDPISKDHGLRLWYENPAEDWNEALPIGNGRIGAMVFGGVASENLQLNEATLWSGGPKDWNNPRAREILPEIRRVLLNQNYAEATELAKKMQGPYTARYLTLGSLFLEMDHPDHAPEQYQRELDLTDAVARVSYAIDGISYAREYFISHPGQLLVMKISAGETGALTFSTRFDNPIPHTVSPKDNHTVVMRGQAPAHVAHRSHEEEQVVYDEGEGMYFEVHLQAYSEDGEITSNEAGLQVREATEVVLLLSMGTSYNGFDQSPARAGQDPAQVALGHLQGASGRSFDALFDDHKKDYQNLFNRVALDLGVDRFAALPTDERLVSFTNAGGYQDPQLTALLFQYGRYLLIASSREGSPPANLQGIWNDRIQPPWGSNYTVNINTEMNYWPANTAALPETAIPLFTFIDHLARNGAVTARVNYGARGWVSHHNSDVWAQTAPAGGYEWDFRGDPRWSMWPMSGAWFTRHLWEHYLFTGDREFLENQAYPLMKGAAEFLIDWLIEGPEGYLVTAPSTSPENSFVTPEGTTGAVSIASTMDLAIIHDLFGNLIKAAEHLERDDEFRGILAERLGRLYPFHVGRHGQLQEWYQDWDRPEDRHRHVSHLYGLFPGNLISPRRTPELAAAAKRSLLMRGDEGTGWALSWKINWWAHLEDGDHAYSILNRQLFVSGMPTANIDDSRGGSYKNLLGAHPPFQIDGNFGFTSGVTEMLVQSSDGAVHLLPALPAAWDEGRVEGLQARGNFTVDIEWEKGKLTRATIHSALGGVLRIRTRWPVLEANMEFVEASGSNPNPFYPLPAEPRFLISNRGNLPELPLDDVWEYDIQTRVGETCTLQF